MAAIMCNQRYGVSDGASGNPEVIVAEDPIRAALGPYAVLEPRIGPANLQVVWDYSRRVQAQFAVAHPRRRPLSSLRPKIKLAHGHKRDNDPAVLNKWPVKIGPRIIPAQEVRDNVGIEEDEIHTNQRNRSRKR